MKKVLGIILIIGLVLTLVACGGGGQTQGGSGGNFPSANINGIVQWGAGGGTDSLMRPLSALAEEHLGVSIIVQNMTGATGSIATQFVYDSDADGYTLLMGAENPALYQALDISQLTYDDFIPVFLVGDETVGILVSDTSPFGSFSEIIEAALAAPGTVRLSTTGAGGLPWSVSAFIYDVTGATFNMIPYESDAAALLAVRSGEVDFTVAKVQSAIEDYRAGVVNFLTMLALETVPTLPHVPLVTEEFPDFARFLPWGPFYGVFVRNDTDPAIVQTLSEAFAAAAADPTYQELLVNFNINFLGLTGDEARTYISNWQENTVNALRASGAID